MLGGSISIATCVHELKWCTFCTEKNTSFIWSEANATHNYNTTIDYNWDKDTLESLKGHHGMVQSVDFITFLFN